jgi:hypothetical protein
MTTAAANSHRYHRWSGRSGPTSPTGGWVNIALTGLRLAYIRSYTRVLFYLSFTFVVAICVLFYFLALLEQLVDTDQAMGTVGFLRTIAGVDLSGVARIGEYRELIWRTVYLAALPFQLGWSLIVVAYVGPGLIANDIKARALPIYFARPINPLTYLLGKWLVAAAFLAMPVLAPNLLSLLTSVLITGGLQTWTQNFALAGDLLVCGLGVMVFGGVIILALSSMTSDSRYVTVAWLAVCLLPLMAQAIVSKALEPDQTTAWLGSISLSGDLTALTGWQLDLRQAWEATPLPPETYHGALARRLDPLYPAIVIAVITVAAALFCYRRVLRFSRAAANV